MLYTKKTNIEINQAKSNTNLLGGTAKEKKKLTIKPNDTDILPDHCKLENFWKYTLLPFPYFKGAR